MSPGNFDRRQITLYVPPSERTRIETYREQFNPVQFSLINAHVTLCRDDEVDEWSLLQERAQEIDSIGVSLEFGLPVKEANLVYLPVIGSTDDFDQLRSQLLNNPNCRKQKPHITIVHPRNGVCSTDQFNSICDEFCEPFTIQFPVLTFIEKHGDAPWYNVISFPVAIQST